MIALSTSWYSIDRFDVRKMLTEIKACGVDSIEIGYNFTRENLNELEKLLPEFGLKVLSVHNFSPAPDPVRGRFFTDLYRISSLNEDERRKSVDFTKQTIDTACRFGAQAVVVHAGTVESVTEQSRNLIRACHDLKQSDEAYKKVKEDFIALREKERGPYVDSAMRSLKEIMDHAFQAGIRIGAETRYYPNEIPNFEEVGFFLQAFYDKGLRYWHDAGHAEVNHRLGLSSHVAYLKSYGDYLQGMHLHDVIELHDHLAPFTGTIDYSFILPYLKPDVFKVIEAHSPATVDQVKKAVEFLSV